MSHDAVVIADLQSKVRAHERQTLRILHVLRATGVGMGADLCFCLAWMNPYRQEHSAACLAARREILALKPTVGFCPDCLVTPTFPHRDGCNYETLDDAARREA